MKQKHSDATPQVFPPFVTKPGTEEEWTQLLSQAFHIPLQGADAAGDRRERLLKRLSITNASHWGFLRVAVNNGWEKKGNHQGATVDGSKLMLSWLIPHGAFYQDELAVPIVFHQKGVIHIIGVTVTRDAIKSDPLVWWQPLSEPGWVDATKTLAAKLAHYNASTELYSLGSYVADLHKEP